MTQRDLNVYIVIRVNKLPARLRRRCNLQVWSIPGPTTGPRAGRGSWTGKTITPGPGPDQGLLDATLTQLTESVVPDYGTDWVRRLRVNTIIITITMSALSGAKFWTKRASSCGSEACTASHMLRCSTCRGLFLYSYD